MFFFWKTANWAFMRTTNGGFPSLHQPTMPHGNYGCREATLPGNNANRCLQATPALPPDNGFVAWKQRFSVELKTGVKTD